MRRALVLLSAVLLTQSPSSPVQSCGSDQVLATSIALSLEAITLAADGRLFSPCPSGAHPPTHREKREAALLDAAASSTNATFRRHAARAFGRIAAPGFVISGSLPRLLGDDNALVRAEAANAIGQALSGTRSDLRQDAAPTTEELAAGHALLETRLGVERDHEVAGRILETLGRLRLNATGLDAIERALVSAAAGDERRVLGAAKGLEALVRRNPRRTIGDAARAKLRELSGFGRDADNDTRARVRRLAMLALQAARDADPRTILDASRDSDWQVRRLAAMVLTPLPQAIADVFKVLLRDPVFQVRIEAIKSYARGTTGSASCAPLAAALGDVAPQVVMQALDSMPATCPERADIAARVAKLAAGLALTDAAAIAAWHVPARALTALGRLAPDDAKRALAGASKHAVWQVRMTAANLAGVLADEPAAVALAADAHPNVRSSAIESLVRMKSGAASAAAIRALTADDHQLVRAAAGALQGTKETDVAVPALLASLERLTAAGKDTSRDPRVAILGRLAELMPPARREAIEAYVGDFDLRVREAAVKARGLGGISPPSRYRYPHQPTAAELRAVPKVARMVMTDGGVIEIALGGDEAPAAVARFASLARSGYYNGLTFHRIATNFVVQGGSPGANEYMGDSRYMRDEVGLTPHLHGSVGISTRGYDTGDAQFYFSLTDLPRLDQDYTVIGRVTTGLDVMDRLLEGATMKSVTVK